MTARLLAFMLTFIGAIWGFLVSFPSGLGIILGRQSEDPAWPHAVLLGFGIAYVAITVVSAASITHRPLAMIIIAAAGASEVAAIGVSGSSYLDDLYVIIAPATLLVIVGGILNLVWNEPDQQI